MSVVDGASSPTFSTLAFSTLATAGAFLGHVWGGGGGGAGAYAYKTQFVY